MSVSRKDSYANQPQERKMSKSVIWEIYRELQETNHFTIPDEFLPAQRGVNLLRWVNDLFTYYREHGTVVRAFDELPPLKLSNEPLIETTIQDVHRFLINDLNLIAPEIRKSVFSHLLSDCPADESWKNISSILLKLLSKMDPETVREELSWKFSPVSEILQALTWFFIEKGEIRPPERVYMRSSRFPYYTWETDDGKQSLWQPENPLCRWEWLAFDLYNKWQKQQS